MRALMRSSAGLGRGPGSVAGADDWPACSPLMLALAHGHDHVARLLIAAGATWAVPITTPSPAAGCPTTALHIMAANSRLGVLEWLVEEQAAARQPRRQRGYCDWPDDQGLFPIHYAALADHQRPADAARLVKALVSLGADPDPGQHTVQSLLRRVRTDRRDTERAITPSPPGLGMPPPPLPTPLEILSPSPGSVWHWQNARAANLHLHRVAHHGALESLGQVVNATPVAAHGPGPAAEVVLGPDPDGRGTEAAVPAGTCGAGDADGDGQRSCVKAAQAVELALRLRHLGLLEELLGRTLEVLQDDDAPASEDEGAELQGEAVAAAAAGSLGGVEASLTSTARFASEHGNRLLANVLQAQTPPPSS
ncbi:putative ankyrin unc44 [Diaporthe ampelina]|uniref:Putative ankyrin unc44 n=1 Tax=Diaporthe ampelina TaxID=1214573 RepID=A0A0G2H5Q4_9PEZI|nr:putative ankyrin unc44 [Diaporthe ampelina]